MCMLCILNPVFAPPKHPNDLNELRRHAAQLKEDLRIFELESESRKRNGQHACPVTDRRIQEIREEMFKLAQRL